MEAERETIDRYVAAFLADKVGQILRCRITGVQPFGFFATVEDLGGDGLVPARDPRQRIFPLRRSGAGAGRRGDRRNLSRRPASRAEAGRGQSRRRARSASSFPKAGSAAPRGAAPRPRPRRPARPAGNVRGRPRATSSHQGKARAKRRRPCPSTRSRSSSAACARQHQPQDRAVDLRARGDNLDCSIVEIGDLPLYNQDLDAQSARAMGPVPEQIAAVDGILFCTPEYNRGMPGVLKNAIDVGSRPYGRSVWDRKPAAIVSASPGVDRRVRSPTTRSARAACSSTCR